MRRALPLLLNFAVLWAAAFSLPAARGEELAAASLADGKTQVVVIPIHEEITEATFYLVRRALKDAEANHAKAVVLDMDTLGGASDAMFEIMEALDKFQGDTTTYINTQAGSAGSLIAGATREIWFAPGAVMGAAAAVESGGEDIPETMRMKVTSFYGAKVRVLARNKGRYRADVLEAMMDSKFVLKIDGVTLKDKDELLSLTADEALKTYGTPPEPLLAAGQADKLDDLLAKKFGAGDFTVTRVEQTWSEKLAVFLNDIAPILTGLGMLALFIEFKTPGFGVFGIVGIALLGIVFLGSYVAGLSGYEPVIAFALGIVLIAVELLLFPGIVIAALTGVVLVLGALVWASADVWPSDPISLTWSGDTLTRPLLNVGLGVLIAALLIFAFLRFLPSTWFGRRMVLSASSVGSAQRSGVVFALAEGLEKLLGREAVAATDLRPGGFVEIDGRRLEARVSVGTVVAGSRVRVVGTSDFAVEVERIPT
jgi:membrane-bound serine protease (ClpP class)